jgi:beta-galactosidase
MITQSKLLLTAAILFLMSGIACAQGNKNTFAIDNGHFVYNGKVTQIHSGEIHYARVPAPYWRHRLKMMRAMGLNAVTTYVFWNHHETAPGVWDWKSGNHNLRQFIRTAQQEGLMVILRPGPYCCAEWEFGGYPWWLQKEKKLVIRTMNQPFLDSCKVYINQLAAQVKDLQVTHGGPVVMVQAENEFGSYVAQCPNIPLATHKQYSATIRQQLLDAGFNIQMFTSDGDWLLKEGNIEGALPTANGETDITKLKTTLHPYVGDKGPFMVAEYYPGWLDHWGEPFQKVPTQNVIKSIKAYLDNGINFNFYMIHGGTNFGFTSGANYTQKIGIQPDLTSYDYDAPISESGWRTEKYDSLRALFKSKANYAIPDVPQQIPVIAIPKISFNKSVSLYSLIGKMKPVRHNTPLTFEDLNQGFGYVLYRKHFGSAVKGMMKVTGLRDYALVYVNRQKVGELNRITGKDSIQLDIPANGTLDIFVENMGRINYGKLITENLKGIISPVTLEGKEITGDWQMYRLPMAVQPNLNKFAADSSAGLPVLYQAHFSLKETGDTFLDMSGWGKGIVFVNGINLGRYWHIGPQQTLYLPGCYLKKGMNTIVVFEQQNDKKQTFVSGIKTPVLDQLRQ